MRKRFFGDAMKLLDSSEVCTFLGISKSTLYRWCGVSEDIFDAADTRSVMLGARNQRGVSLFDRHKEETPKNFPKPFKIGRAYKWNDEEIFSWLEAQRVK